MAKALKDRLLLRRISRAFHQEPFSKQNQVVAKQIHISPKWIHQSRLNYRYIYNNLKSYWPTWALNQFSPKNPESTPPSTELSCLNTSDLNYFTFIDNEKNQGLCVSDTGYITFPNHNWGLSIQHKTKDSSTPIFDKSFYLDADNNRLHATQKNEHETFSSTMGYDNQRGVVQLTIQAQNKRPEAAQITIQMGVLPFINEGVGNIKTIQYISTKQMIINDRSIISCATQADDILCTNYDAGNIFERSKDWNMILNANCDQCLASGLLTFTLNFKKNEKKSLYFEIAHLQSFLTPLAFPISTIKPDQFKRHILDDNVNAMPTILSPNVSFNLQGDSKNLVKINTCIKNFLLTLKNNAAIYSTPALFYNLNSCMMLDSKDAFNDLVDHYFKYKQNYQSSSFLMRSQQDLFNLITIVKYQHLFRLSSDSFQEKLFKQINKTIKKDPFNHLVSSLTSQQFNKLISEPRGFQILFKLMFFSFLMTELKNMRRLNKDGRQCLNTCQHFLKVIQNQPSLYQSFIDQFYKTEQMPMNEKLFYSRIIFPNQLPNQPFSMLIDQFKQHWNDQFLFSNKTNECSELTPLLFAFLSSKEDQQAIIQNYFNGISSFGNYFSRQSYYHTFKEFPKPYFSFNGIFISLFFNQIFQTQENSLYIHAGKHYNKLTLSGLKTHFGRLDLNIVTESSTKIIKLNHEFHSSPNELFIIPSEQSKSYSFGLNEPKIPFNTPYIKVPLNKPCIYLFS